MKFENRRHDGNESQSSVRYSEQSHTSNFVALFNFSSIQYYKERGLHRMPLTFSKVKLTNFHGYFRERSTSSTSPKKGNSWKRGAGGGSPRAWAYFWQVLGDVEIQLEYHGDLINGQ